MCVRHIQIKVLVAIVFVAATLCQCDDDAMRQ